MSFFDPPMDAVIAAGRENASDEEKAWRAAYESVPGIERMLGSMPSCAYTHNGDETYMRSLGLKTYGFGRSHTYVGTVTIYEDEPEGPRVDCYVGAMPAQFFKFVVHRPNENAPGETETLTITTGSGSFQEYWPVAKMVAENMLDVQHG